LIPPQADGEREFLAGLTEEQLAKFNRLSVAERRDWLKPHAHGLDPVIAKEQKKRLGAAKRPDAAAPVPPLMTTVELIARLPGGPAPWVQVCAERFSRDFRDQKFWRQFLRVANAVWLGTLDAKEVLNAYRQAMKPHIMNRGAKFWAALRGLAGIDAMALASLAEPGKSRGGKP